MFTTASETEARTTARLIRAMDNEHPVTITYTKADGTETLRTIEIYDFTTSKAGDVLIKAMDRTSGESRTFRLDRLVAYTVHRTAYTVPRETTTTTPVSHGLRAAAVVLAPHPLAPTVPVEQRVSVLAGYLAAA